MVIVVTVVRGGGGGGGGGEEGRRGGGPNLRWAFWGRRGKSVPKPAAGGKFWGIYTSFEGEIDHFGL